MVRVRLPYLLVALLLAAATAAVLLGMGQPLTCTCGTIELWAGGASSPKTSQMIADWYAPSHMIHGFLFFGLFWLVARKRPVEHRFLWAVMLEGLWEIVENSPTVLERYRSVTIEVGYYGDSVVNSMADLAFMSLGFLLARKLPLWASIAFIVIAEVAAAIAIRNNLFFSSLMLIAPQQWVLDWQSGGSLF
ncbi:DUF2585 family protein [Sphingomicrobium nitratireducens]|uniref:DUF2585 family protein n=1 Tax=Sphingomicrobium nitratireducens TaxID=2964666 RepID=UPI00224088DF|nr:DUF2585 family protein [Sphingomicrobium nitratireducens]